MSKLVSFFLIEVIVTLYLLIIRPFEEAKVNIIEIINEVFLSFITGGLIYYSKKERWNDFVKWTFIGGIMGSIFVNMVVSIVHMYLVFRIGFFQRFPPRKVFIYRSREYLEKSYIEYSMKKVKKDKILPKKQSKTTILH